ncbi:hypothetical protein A3H53_00130 [Candidatus Nomurabacteria bacterium RIFCSPLOWO2_02_FULL_40_10]|uniref:DUF454 domain-containing protein n=2 Tax=Candidatus Nomuraibacteriota TaxID=1752729 RepID=A0A1F6XZW8_9BACT|nr:MAG: hypothetical protein A2642_01160 [Candidatus Nomurabacteria bacterium RIFCSPHIGHO2_01_FULL_39_10]OGI99665.1 MAG: hypothetical protein A3H53_00130 [Candidatus Nomurabacteria bacterium RIFCSPLOWO2_02_FULL_40_10]
MQKQAKKVIILTIGVIFIIFGLIGLVLPFLQGIIFLIIGFLLISLYFPKVRAHIRRHAQKSASVLSFFDKTERWLAKFIGEV